MQGCGGEVRPGEAADHAQQMWHTNVRGRVCFYHVDGANNGIKCQSSCRKSQICPTVHPEGR